MPPRRKGTLGYCSYNKEANSKLK
uniref:Uncharacterized protein n=1 Tax=Anguilla anguilla TaxID=7936 RepID=A0A0E9R102_ANGAN